jgi:hypothetical protein
VEPGVVVVVAAAGPDDTVNVLVVGPVVDTDVLVGEYEVG